MKTKRFFRIMAIVLALVLMLGTMPWGVLAEESETAAKVEQWNMTLTDDLRVNFYLNIPDDTKDNTQIQVTVGGGTPVSYTPSQLESKDGYYVVSASIAAAQMTENINIAILTDGAEVVNSNYTAAQYADTVLERDDMSQYHELVLHMLNYGAKAQLYFEYNTDDLANAGHELTEEAVIPSKGKDLAIDGSVTGISIYGASLLFQNKIGIRFYFNAPGGVDDYTFTVGETEYEAIAKGDQYYVQVNGINPQCYDEDVTLTVSDGTSSQTVTYSPMHYIVRKSQNNSSSETLKALLRAMYGYHLAACEAAKASMTEITIDGVIVEDTYVNATSKDTNYAEKTELNANNSKDYRPLFKFDLSDKFDSEELAANKKYATVSFTFGVSTGADLLAEADYSIYGFLPGEGASDVDFTTVTWNTVKEGVHSKLYRYSGNENCVFLKKEVSSADVADIVTVTEVEGKTYITYTLDYSDIEQFICTDEGDTYGYLVMGFDFQQSIKFASMENTSYNAPAVSVTYFNEEAEQYAKEIYISSIAADGGDGSIEDPYNSLDVISTLKIGEGTHIYLERGSQFSGQLLLSDVSGSENDPIVVASYGDGDKPKIDGNGLTGTGVLRIKNCSNIIVKNLELTDSVTTEGDRRGVLITCDNNAGTDEVITYENITLQNLYIHDIHGYLDAQNSGMSTASKKTGGIHVWSNDGLGRIDGLNITDCKITDVSNVGIATWYSPDGTTKISPYDESFKDYAHLNVKISNNEISNIGKNAIFVRNLYGGVVEKNVIHDTALYCVSGNTIVTSYVDGTVIEYNEGYNNIAQKASDGALQDGCMLDADLASKDTVWQYNYSHDNAFGLFINCTSSEDVVTVRYNLSVNDHGDKGIIYINNVSNGIYVYNNTIVTGDDAGCIIQSSENGRSYIYNNLIYNRSAGAKFAINEAGEMASSYNLIYNEDGCSIADTDYFTNENGISADPLFVGYPQMDSTLGIENLHGYILQAESPALGVGAAVEGVDTDIFGNAYRQSIGAYCGKGHAYTSLSVQSNLKYPIASTVVQASDLSVTATCSCGKSFVITDGIEIENAKLALGENTLTVKYGGISADLTIVVTEEATVLGGTVIDDTYVSNDYKDTAYTTREELGTYSDAFRDYFRVNISDALASELFQDNKNDAKIRLVLTVTSGDATGAEIILKTYAPAEGVTNVDFTALTWNSVNNKEGSVGTYSQLHWNNGIVLAPSTSVTNGNIVITLDYNDIADYVDGDGNILLVLGTHTSGLKVGSIENATESNKPVVMVVLGEVHFCVYDQEVATEQYFVSANCEEKAKYYLSCTCGEHGEDTFEYGDVISHSYVSISAESNLEAPTANTVVQASDLSVTAACGACGESIAVTDGIELEGVLLAAGENTVTVKYGELSTTVIIEAVEQTNVLTGTVTDDTYVDSSNKTSDFTAKETLNTYSSSFRTYLRVNISNILANEQFLANKENAQVQIVLAIAGGTITDSTTYTLKTYAPTEGVTDIAFSDITWSNVSTNGTYSGLNWGSGTALTTSVSADGSNIILTLAYSDIAEYVDENGNILFAFATNTSGLKVASNENTAYAAPAFQIVWDEN